MTEPDAQLNLRIPESLRSLIRDASKGNRRSQTAEVIARLQESFIRDGSLKGSGNVRLHNADPDVRELIAVMEMLTNQLDLMRKELNDRMQGLKGSESEDA